MLKTKKRIGRIPSLGMYVHVPFCSTTCDFCAFYQERPSKKGFDSYFNGLKREFQLDGSDRFFSTIFIGGGTPGILSTDQLEEIGSLIKAQNLSSPLEWTVEIAPAEITSEKLETMLEIGVTRISLGIQTFDSSLMQELGRAHSVETALKSYSLVRSVGFESVNLDLIFGMPGQSEKMWEKDLRQAVELEPDHLSTYCLTFEEDTALFVKLSKGELKIDPEKEAVFYEKAWDFLPQQGYAQYEISNFAKPGNECIHNLNTWGMNEWIGYGPSASTQYKGIRRKNLSNLEAWEEQTKFPEKRNFEEFQKMDSDELAHDAVTFGLRMNQGISLDEIAENFDLPLSSFEPIESFLWKLHSQDLVEKNLNWKLSKKGRMLADGVIREMPEII